MPRRPPPPPPNNRRRFLVALGFGAANVALIRSVAVPEVVAAGNAPSVPTGDDVETAAPITDRGPGVVSVVDPSLLEPPALADAGPEVDYATHIFDTAIRGGRVVDPMSGFDGLLNVGINGGVITAITATELQATNIIDASGKIVSPGFVDILSYAPNPFGVWFKVSDGVTTNLGMHGINNYASAFFSRYEGTTPIHYGGAFHQHFMRGHELGAAPDKPLDDAQVATFVGLAAENITNGYAGVAFSPEYSPATSKAEIDALAAVARDRGHSAFFHTRSSDPATSQAGVLEVIDLARRTGIGVHISHISSTGATGHMALTLESIEAARLEGLDVTACVYPYEFWATTLQSFRFVGDWQARYGISYEDLQVAGTDRRLTKDTYGAAFADNELVAALGSIPAAEVEMALAKPWVMLGSDAILTESLNNHPRSSGTFARMLGHYSREAGLVDLPTALAKMTSLPTRRVEAMIPAMQRKGRLQRGADADITIFDAAVVADQATVGRPDLPSIGIQHVLVEGQAVLADGVLQRTVLPGRPLRSA